MTAMFYREDKDKLSAIVDLVNDPPISDSERKLALVFANQRFPQRGSSGRDSRLRKIRRYSRRSAREQVLLRLPGEADRIAHPARDFFFKFSRAIVWPRRTWRFARAIARRSARLERMSSVSIRPSYSSALRSTAFSTPFRVITTRWYFSSASRTREDKYFFASASGYVFRIGSLSPIGQKYSLYVYQGSTAADRRNVWLRA